ncbi:MAG: hypothetical protein Kow0031_17810 [Anaerolineae bacterium]
MNIDTLLSHHQFLVDQAGNKTAVLVDLSTWQKIVDALIALATPEQVEALEDFALNRAMDEAADSPALSRAEALAMLAAEE